MANNEARQKRAEHVPADVGRRLRRARLQAGLSLEEAGSDAGVGRSHLSQVERGLANLSLPAFIGVCGKIGASPGAILDPPQERAQSAELEAVTEDLLDRLGPVRTQWLASLDRTELKLAIDRGREAVLYRRAKR